MHVEIFTNVVDTYIEGQVMKLKKEPSFLLSCSSFSFC